MGERNIGTCAGRAGPTPADEAVPSREFAAAGPSPGSATAPALRPFTRRRRRVRGPSGFTLLEIVVAFMIFFMMASAAYVAMFGAVDQSIDAERARQLRMLAERKLAELALFERHHDDLIGPVEFEDLPDEIREQYQGWEWQIEIRDVTVFGTQKDENAPYLFSENDPGTDGQQTATDASSASTKKKGDTQLLREIVLKVTAPADDGGAGDSIEVVTFLPQVAAKAAAPATPAGSGN